jgi:hypothetical protein
MQREMVELRNFRIEAFPPDRVHSWGAWALSPGLIRVAVVGTSDPSPVTQQRRHDSQAVGILEEELCSTRGAFAAVSAANRRLLLSGEIHKRPHLRAQAGVIVCDLHDDGRATLLRAGGGLAWFGRRGSLMPAFGTDPLDVWSRKLVRRLVSARGAAEGRRLLDRQYLGTPAAYRSTPVGRFPILKANRLRVTIGEELVLACLQQMLIAPTPALINLLDEEAAAASQGISFVRVTRRSLSPSGGPELVESGKDAGQLLGHVA